MPDALAKAADHTVRIPQQASAESLNLGIATAAPVMLRSLGGAAGVALLAFGSGPVRGFAVVHCLGILTSMFSAVVVARGFANLWYGRQKKLTKISIGTVWQPGMSPTKK